MFHQQFNVKERTLFTRKIVTGAAGLLMIAGTSFGAVSAHATAATVCQVHGAVHITSGSGILIQTASNDTYAFGSTSITCTSSDPVLNGVNINVHSVGTANTETCGSASGAGSVTGTFTGGSLGGGSLDSSNFTYQRNASNVAINGGLIKVHNGPTYTFNAALEFTPTNGECHGTLGVPTKDAGIDGAAEIAP